MKTIHPFLLLAQKVTLCALEDQYFLDRFFLEIKTFFKTFFFFKDITEFDQYLMTKMHIKYLVQF